MASSKELISLCDALLERLDDSKDDVRICTCSALEALAGCLEPQTQAAMFETLAETALLHLDDANEVMQQSIFSLLSRVSTFNHSAFEKKIKSADKENLQGKSRLLLHQFLS